MIKQSTPIELHWPTQEPFLFCAHHLDRYPEGNKNLGLDSKHFAGRQMGSDFNEKDGFRIYHGEEIPGFPVHPHRGFETITIVRRGYADHADSLGAAGRYGEGDVQWMTQVQVFSIPKCFRFFIRIKRILWNFFKSGSIFLRRTKWSGLISKCFGLRKFHE